MYKNNYKKKYQKYKHKYLYLYGGLEKEERKTLTSLSHSVEDNESAYEVVEKELIMEDFQNQHSKCPENKAVYPKVSRIISIGDLHGDFNAMFRALRLAKLVNKKGDWIGGNTYVVQVGDILDCNRGGSHICSSGAEEIKILDYFFKLNREAQKEGGSVINILGNHELMNVLGDFRYASEQHTEAMGGLKKRYKLFRPGGDIAKKMACYMQPIVKIGNYLFVHGAILPSHLESDIPKKNEEKLQLLVDLVKQYLLGKLSLEEFKTKYPKEFKIVNPNGEMFWTRELSNPHNSKNKCMKAKSVLEKLGADKGAIIMGHTVHPKITSDCDRRLWKIDVGMSEGFESHSKIQVLEILENGKKITVLE